MLLLRRGSASRRFIDIEAPLPDANGKVSGERERRSARRSGDSTLYPRHGGGEIHASFRDRSPGDPRSPRIPNREAAVDMSMKKYAKLASLGALGVAGGVVALFALLAWVSTPTPTGGIDGDHATIAYLGIAVPLLAIAVVHLVYARQLARYAKRDQDAG